MMGAHTYGASCMQFQEDKVTIESILEAYDAIRQHVKNTPLIRAEKLEELFDGAEIYLKLENVQHTGSFKVRGVANKMLGMCKDGDCPEFCVLPTTARMEQDYIRADEPEYGSPP